jgi:hypothetical protein
MNSEMKLIGLLWSRRFGDAVAGEHHDRALDHGDARAGSQADEGIAAEALAALHRFEQVGVGLVGQLEVDRQRRVEVGEGFERDGNAVVAFRREAVEFCFSHGMLRNSVRRIDVRDAAARAGIKPAWCRIARARPPPTVQAAGRISSIAKCGGAWSGLESQKVGAGGTAVERIRSGVQPRPASKL